MPCLSCQQKAQANAAKKQELKKLTLNLSGDTRGLENNDICPLCCANKWYYCKNGCIGDKEGCKKILEANQKKGAADATV